MEEILASIRRIISEDEPAAEAEGEAPPVAAAAPPASTPEPVAEPAPQPPPAPVAAAAPAAEPPAAPPPPPQPETAPALELEDEDDDALELTQKVETHGDIDVLEPVAAAAPPPTPPRPEPGLVSEPAAEAAASAFGRLSAAIAMPRSDRTLEDVVRELLRPLLQQWLDENLPKIVQEAVTAEVERIARGR